MSSAHAAGASPNEPGPEPGEGLEMKPIRKIIAAADLSPVGEEVLRAARELADQTGARVEVVHVVYDLSAYMGFYLGTGPIAELQQELERKAKTRLDEACAKAFSGTTAPRSAIIKGTPFADLIRHLVEREADLVVVGAHGSAKPEHKIFGSTAERLVKCSPCPVLVVGQRGY